VTTGNEPMLPRDHDDSPMISSVQTRAIADARGAYLVGNLDAVIDSYESSRTTAVPDGNCSTDHKLPASGAEIARREPGNSGKLYR
jgi:hypothetical protein